MGSAEAQAAWRGVGHFDESHRSFTKYGALQFLLEMAPEAKRTGAMVSFITPGPFSQALVAGDTILAFTRNGEAHWFRIHRREQP